MQSRRQQRYLGLGLYLQALGKSWALRHLPEVRFVHFLAVAVTVSVVLFSSVCLTDDRCLIAKHNRVEDDHSAHIVVVPRRIELCVDWRRLIPAFPRFE